MAIIWGRPKIELKLGIEMTEAEVRALYEIMQYNVEPFIKMFCEKMGTTYLEKHEDGMRSLFKSFQREAMPWLLKADKARKAFEEGNNPHVS